MILQVPGALLNGAISTYNLKSTARNEGILPMLIAGWMINSNLLSMSIMVREPPSCLCRREKRQAEMMLVPWEAGDLEGQGRSRRWGSTVPQERLPDTAL